MKDPLQQKPTPYEILDIDGGRPVDKKIIETQFKKNFNKQGAREARNTLDNPLYLVLRRREVADAWTGHLQKYFPYYPLTFHLALVWYWWAIYMEEKTWAQVSGSPFEEVKGLSPAPDLEALWKNAILYWVCLINSGEFWQEWFVLKQQSGIALDPAHHLGELQSTLEEHFVNHFHTFSERYRLGGDIPASRRYREYERWFSTEMKTAADISQAGVGRTVGGKKYFICCGQMLLEQIREIDRLKGDIRQEAETGLRDMLNVSWLILTIKIPRCRACREVHKKSGGQGLGLGCLSGIILSAAVMLLAHRFSLLYFVLVNVLTSLTGGIIHHVTSGDLRKFTHRLEHQNNFPLIKEKEKEGWKLGDKSPVEAHPKRSRTESPGDSPHRHPAGQPGHPGGSGGRRVEPAKK